MTDLVQPLDVFLLDVWVDRFGRLSPIVLVGPACSGPSTWHHVILVVGGQRHLLLALVGQVFCQLPLIMKDGKLAHQTSVIDNLKRKQVIVRHHYRKMSDLLYLFENGSLLGDVITDFDVMSRQMRLK